MNQTLGFGDQTTQNQDAKVFVIQLLGQFTCTECSSPSAASVPTGTAAQDVLSFGSLAQTDFGLTPHAVAMQRMVPVMRLAWKPTTPPSHRSTGAPFTAPGGVASGPDSGLWGDTSSGPTGDQIGCFPGRRYAQAVTLRNRSALTVTITGVRGLEPAPRIIRRVAVQLRLAPQTSNREGLAGGGGLKSWSKSQLVPMAVPPGRSAVVQSNFLMRRCDQLPPHEALTVNRAIVVAYAAGQRTGHQRITNQSASIILTRGPTIRRCSTPQGATRLDAYDITCNVAQRAAVECHQLAQGRTETAQQQVSNGTARSRAHRKHATLLAPIEATEPRRALELTNGPPAVRSPATGIGRWCWWRGRQGHRSGRPLRGTSERCTATSF